MMDFVILNSPKVWIFSAVWVFFTVKAGLLLAVEYFLQCGVSTFTFKAVLLLYFYSVDWALLLSKQDLHLQCSITVWNDYFHLSKVSANFFHRCLYLINDLNIVLGTLFSTLTVLVVPCAREVQVKLFADRKT